MARNAKGGVNSMHAHASAGPKEAQPSKTFLPDRTGHEFVLQPLGLPRVGVAVHEDMPHPDAASSGGRDPTQTATSSSSNASGVAAGGTPSEAGSAQQRRWRDGGRCVSDIRVPQAQDSESSQATSAPSLRSVAAEALQLQRQQNRGLSSTGGAPTLQGTSVWDQPATPPPTVPGIRGRSATPTGMSPTKWFQFRTKWPSLPRGGGASRRSRQATEPAPSPQVSTAESPPQAAGQAHHPPVAESPPQAARDALNGGGVAAPVGFADVTASPEDNMLIDDSPSSFGHTVGAHYASRVDETQRDPIGHCREKAAQAEDAGGASGSLGSSAQWRSSHRKKRRAAEGRQCHARADHHEADSSLAGGTPSPCFASAHVGGMDLGTWQCSMEEQVQKVFDEATHESEASREVAPTRRRKKRIVAEGGHAADPPECSSAFLLPGHAEAASAKDNASTALRGCSKRSSAKAKNRRPPDCKLDEAVDSTTVPADGGLKASAAGASSARPSASNGQSSSKVARAGGSCSEAHDLSSQSERRTDVSVIKTEHHQQASDAVVPQDVRSIIPPAPATAFEDDPSQGKALASAQTQEPAVSCIEAAELNAFAAVRGALASLVDDLRARAREGTATALDAATRGEDASVLSKLIRVAESDGVDLEAILAAQTKLAELRARKKAFAERIQAAELAYVGDEALAAARGALASFDRRAREEATAALDAAVRGEDEFVLTERIKEAEFAGVGDVSLATARGALASLVERRAREEAAKALDAAARGEDDSVLSERIRMAESDGVGVEAIIAARAKLSERRARTKAARALDAAARGDDASVLADCIKAAEIVGVGDESLAAARRSLSLLLPHRAREEALMALDSAERGEDDEALAAVSRTLALLERRPREEATMALDTSRGEDGSVLAERFAAAELAGVGHDALADAGRALSVLLKRRAREQPTPELDAASQDLGTSPTNGKRSKWNMSLFSSKLSVPWPWRQTHALPAGQKGEGRRIESELEQYKEGLEEERGRRCSELEEHKQAVQGLEEERSRRRSALGEHKQAVQGLTEESRSAHSELKEHTDEETEKWQGIVESLREAIEGLKAQSGQGLEEERRRRRAALEKHKQAVQGLKEESRRTHSELKKHTEKEAENLQGMVEGVAENLQGMVEGVHDVVEGLKAQSGQARKRNEASRVHDLLRNLTEVRDPTYWQDQLRTEIVSALAFRNRAGDTRPIGRAYVLELVKVALDNKADPNYMFDGKSILCKALENLGSCDVLPSTRHVAEALLGHGANLGMKELESFFEAWKCGKGQEYHFQELVMRRNVETRRQWMDLYSHWYEAQGITEKTWGKKGITLRQLNELYEDNQTWIETLQFCCHKKRATLPSMHNVKDNIIRPRTSRLKCGYTDLLPSGKIDVFVSHNWNEVFAEFVRTLNVYAEAFGAKLAPLDPAGVRFWICSFVISQHNPDVGDNLDESPFAKALEGCQHVVCAVDREATLFTRIWCLYELFLNVDAGRSIEFACPDGVLSKSVQPSVYQKAALKKLADCEPEKAKATEDADLKKIKDAIEKRCGFEKFKARVRSMAGIMSRFACLDSDYMDPMTGTKFHIDDAQPLKLRFHIDDAETMKSEDEAEAGSLVDAEAFVKETSKQFQRCLVVGEAGSGKTIFTKQIMLNIRKHGKILAARVSAFELQAYENNFLESWVRKNFKDDDDAHLKMLLCPGDFGFERTLVVIDGLDKGFDNFQSIVNWAHTWSAGATTRSVLLTMRSDPPPQGDIGVVQQLRFRKYHVEKFDDKLAKNLVRKCLEKNLVPRDAWGQIFEKLKGLNGVRESPLLCSMFARVGLLVRGPRIPNGEIEFVSEALWAMLGSETESDRQKLLCLVAGSMTAEGGVPPDGLRRIPRRELPPDIVMRIQRCDFPLLEDLKVEDLKGESEKYVQVTHLRLQKHIQDAWPLGRWTGTWSGTLVARSKQEAREERFMLGRMDVSLKLKRDRCGDRLCSLSGQICLKRSSEQDVLLEVEGEVVTPQCGHDARATWRVRIISPLRQGLLQSEGQCFDSVGAFIHGAVWHPADNKTCLTEGLSICAEKGSDGRQHQARDPHGQMLKELRTLCKDSPAWKHTFGEECRRWDMIASSIDNPLVDSITGDVLSVETMFLSDLLISTDGLSPINGQQFIDQLREGELYLVFGTPGSGKTTFTKQVSWHMVKSEKNFVRMRAKDWLDNRRKFDMDSSLEGKELLILDDIQEAQDMNEIRKQLRDWAGSDRIVIAACSKGEESDAKGEDSDAYKWEGFQRWYLAGMSNEGAHSWCDRRFLNEVCDCVKEHFKEYAGVPLRPLHCSMFVGAVRHRFPKHEDHHHAERVDAPTAAVRIPAAFPGSNPSELHSVALAYMLRDLSVPDRRELFKMIRENQVICVDDLPEAVRHMMAQSKFPLLEKVGDKCAVVHSSIKSHIDERLPIGPWRGPWEAHLLCRDSVRAQSELIADIVNCRVSLKLSGETCAVEGTGSLKLPSGREMGQRQIVISGRAGKPGGKLTCENPAPTAHTSWDVKLELAGCGTGGSSILLAHITADADSLQDFLKQCHQTRLDDFELHVSNAAEVLAQGTCAREVLELLEGKCEEGTYAQRVLFGECFDHELRVCGLEEGIVVPMTGRPISIGYLPSFFVKQKHDETPRNAKKFVAQLELGNNFLLVAEDGKGKTTFTKQLIWHAKSSRHLKNTTVLRVTAAELGCIMSLKPDEADLDVLLLDWVATRCKKNRSAIDAALIWLIVDGIDEVSSDFASNICNMLRNWARARDRSVFGTCAKARSTEVNELLREANFKELQFVDMPEGEGGKELDNDVQKFVKHYWGDNFDDWWVKPFLADPLSTSMRAFLVRNGHISQTGELDELYSEALWYMLKDLSLEDRRTVLDQIREKQVIRLSELPKAVRDRVGRSEFPLLEKVEGGCEAVHPSLKHHVAKGLPIGPWQGTWEVFLVRQVPGLSCEEPMGHLRLDCCRVSLKLNGDICLVAGHGSLKLPSGRELGQVVISGSARKPHGSAKNRSPAAHTSWEVVIELTGCGTVANEGVLARVTSDADSLCEFLKQTHEVKHDVFAENMICVYEPSTRRPAVDHHAYSEGHLAGSEGCGLGSCVESIAAEGDGALKTLLRLYAVCGNRKIDDRWTLRHECRRLGLQYGLGQPEEEFVDAITGTRKSIQKDTVELRVSIYPNMEPLNAKQFVDILCRDDESRQRYLLEGDAGSGKTVFAKQVAAQVASRKACLVVCVPVDELRDCIGKDLLLSWLDSRCGRGSVNSEVFKNVQNFKFSHAVFILDGLDTAPEQHWHLLQLVDKWARTKNVRRSVIVTCRRGLVNAEKLRDAKWKTLSFKDMDMAAKATQVTFNPTWCKHHSWLEEPLLCSILATVMGRLKHDDLKDPSAVFKAFLDLLFTGVSEVARKALFDVIARMHEDGRSFIALAEIPSEIAKLARGSWLPLLQNVRGVGYRVIHQDLENYIVEQQSNLQKAQEDIEGIKAFAKDREVEIQAKVT